MEKQVKNFQKVIAALGVAVFLMAAGWQVGLGNIDEGYLETEEALEVVVAGSGGEGSHRCIVDADTGGTNIDCKKSGSLCNYDSHCIP